MPPPAERRVAQQELAKALWVVADGRRLVAPAAEAGMPPAFICGRVAAGTAGLSAVRRADHAGAGAGAHGLRREGCRGKELIVCHASAALDPRSVR
jgi:hypothetical protein